MITHSLLINSIADQLLYRSLFSNKLGLLNGKMGMAIFFYYYARYTGNKWYDDFAGELLDEIFTNISQDMSITFESGLCGIGWGIVFLESQGYIEGDMDEVLQDLDSKIMERDLSRVTDFSLDTGLEGTIAYVRSRNCIQINTNLNRFDEIFIDNLDKVCNSHQINWGDDYYSVTKVWNRILHSFSMLSIDNENNWKKILVEIA